MHGRPINDFEALNQVEREEAVRRMTADFRSSDREMKRITKMTEERPRLQEEIFFYVFLPYFANTEECQHYFKDDEYQTAHEKAMLAWQHVLCGGQRPDSNDLRVANWMYSEVDIVKADGSVAITVPPLLQFNHIDTLHKNPDRKDVFAVVQRSNIQARVSTRHGELALRNGLSDAAKGLVNDEAIIENIRRWNAVFAHYHFPTFKFKDDAQVPTASAAGAAPVGTTSTTYDLNDFEDD